METYPLLCYNYILYCKGETLMKDFVFETVQISGKEYKVGTYFSDCPYRLPDILEEIKKVDEFNYCKKLYELDFKILPEDNWDYNIPTLELLDYFYSGKLSYGLDDKMIKNDLLERIDKLYKKLYERQKMNKSLFE